MYYDNYVVIDIETTGFSISSGARILWISCLKINNKNIVDKSFWILKTEAYVSKSIGKVIEINQLNLQNCLPPELVLPDFFKFVKDLPVVTHFAKFVSDFMEYECSLIGFQGFLKYVCTYDMARIAFPSDKNSIDTLVKRFGLFDKTETNISGDTYQVYEIYEKLKELLIDTKFNQAMPLVAQQPNERWSTGASSSNSWAENTKKFHC